MKLKKRGKTRHHIESGQNFAANVIIIQSPENSYISRTPRSSIMVNPTISAANWNSANPSLYHMPWTSDKQNRFFSLNPMGGGKEITFSIKYLGRPTNVAFKSKFKFSGRTEPALCVCFPSTVPHLEQPTYRLVHPDNFVRLNPFTGYDPIEEKVIRQAKSIKASRSGAWYKKVWGFHCKAVLPEEYKEPPMPPTVSRAPPSQPPTAKTNQSKESAMSDDEDEGDDSDDDDEGDEKEKNTIETSEGGITVIKEPHPILGRKEPRDTHTLEQCIKMMRRKMKIERYDNKINEKQEKKQLKHNAYRQLLKESGEVVDDDDAMASSCSDTSEDELESDFEYKAEREGKKMFEQFQEFHATPSKKAERSSSSGSVSGSGGKYELCCASLFLFVLL